MTAALALAAPAPAPPATAQLAPSSRQATAEPEPDTPTPTPEQTGPENPYAGIDRSRVRRCVGEPPRQTEDPMSPPCVAYWDGENNGGDTTKGVTKTQINLVVPGGLAQLGKGIGGIIEHFNSRYEFYGRKINVQYLTTEEFVSLLNPAQYGAYAEQIDTEMNAFGVITAGGLDGSTSTLYDLLADRGIISVDVAAGFRTEEELSQGPNADYKWSFSMSDDNLQEHVAEFVCKNLVGKRAIHAGDGLTDTTRRFGLIVQRNPTGASMTGSVLAAGLRACDASLAPTERMTYTWNAQPPTPSAPTVLAKLRSQGVTSVMCVCTNHVVGQALIASEELGWEPEWISTGTGFQGSDSNLAAFWPQNQLAHYFGVSAESKVNSYPGEAWFVAAREGDPTITAAYMQNQHSNWGLTLEAMYQSMLIFATGIQGAGPNLTPETFAAALREAEFTNPGAGGPPYYQQRIELEAGEHSFVKDATLTYWDPTIRPYDDPQLGTFCYVNHGRRYTLGNWPSNTEEKFYGKGRPADVPCR
ncbi:ABC transporter substrate-binding protein [Actinopolymorpha sp. B9G3]|uniref:ABC transporter substrate-binding protein n=1 Tax=Actinopolymorpha sp. B9G3 TaxID=3158970 RepID=UPI0032D94739